MNSFERDREIWPISAFWTSVELKLHEFDILGIDAEL